MTRKEIEQEYDVVNGVIINSGKFENEPVYAPYFYSISLDGGADEVEADEADIFYVTEEDIKEFPELKGEHRVRLCEDNNGFIYCAPAL